MKLLFDENLSPKLPGLIAGSVPGSLHARDCGLKGATDAEIWEYARVEDSIVVSKDRDFYERSLLVRRASKIRLASGGELHARHFAGVAYPACPGNPGACRQHARMHADRPIK